MRWVLCTHLTPSKNGDDTAGVRRSANCRELIAICQEAERLLSVGAGESRTIGKTMGDPTTAEAGAAEPSNEPPGTAHRKDAHRAAGLCMIVCVLVTVAVWSHRSARVLTVLSNEAG